MRAFLADGGKVGYALKGDDIVSVFRHPDSKVPGVLSSLIPQAVANGGRRLDCFDTALPRLYSDQGFVAVSRCKFDPKFAPPGWDYKQFAKFNKGMPDIVFMRYAPGSATYKPGDGKMFPDYDSAQAAQIAAVKAANAQEARRSGRRRGPKI